MGAILAHAVAVSSGTLRKGTILGPVEIAGLIAGGCRTVIVAQLESNDLHEDLAATRIAGAIMPDPAGQGLRASRAATGRVNLYATGPGVLSVEEEKPRIAPVV